MSGDTSEPSESEQPEENGLQTLDLSISYRSGRNDLLNEFYIPCLKQATHYDRAAGYFDSKSLVQAAQGISGLILNDGQMRLLVSPRLSPEDIRVLEQAADEDEEEGDTEGVIEHALHRGLTEEQFADYLKRDRFRCMAWMLKEGLLEIRIAYLSDANTPEEANPFRHYHEKIGVLSDDYGNKVSFTGSINETELGWTGNYESFKVFPNWKPGLGMVTVEDEDDFNRLWENRDPKVTVKELPDAVETGLEEHSPDTVNGRPDLEQFEDEDDGGSGDTPGDIPLWDHQQESIDRWIANDYRGIFAMATGTGKTRAAISAANLGADTRLSVVAVPSSPLLTQWKEDIQELIPKAEVLVCNSDTNWRKRILDVVSPYKLGEPKYIQDRPKQFIVTTIDTAIGDTFQSFVRDISSEHIQVVADEVHGYGADTYRQLFDIDAGRRVGLSATPERRFDDEGNQEIMGYFDDIIFRFETAEAIENGYLSEYDYHPLICELDEEEYEEYRKYSQMIAQVHSKLQKAKAGSKRELRKRDERLKRDRAKMLKKAEAKPGRFGRFLDTEHPTPAIIFCEDNEQVDAIQDQLRSKGKSFAVYVSDMDDEKRASSFYKFENDMVDYLLAINCLDEGIDVPKCPTAVIISSSSNERQFIQRRGRVLRKSEEKAKAVLYDMITLPGLSAEQGDESARRFIEKELKRGKVLMEAANNREQVRLDLRGELQPYGFGHLAYL
ncbi:DEAD/DEAH box helicase family protein [Halorarum salinum]|uniref:DEAD/DEAH box helicase family protein n=1 Tax=Halorarum salinum TaxID=2743089 RepID=A0A7D5QAS5_9EURY|nr:DEAD/DEAH box helicase family protein [Halobaculum salinum]QLG62018.1 DEAD/DEAH box helicase family protein [Halobaculum salinum]